MYVCIIGKELFEKISFGECRLGFVPFDSDMLSLEMDSVFKQVFIYKYILMYVGVCVVCVFPE